MVGSLLAKKLNKRQIDLDQAIVDRIGNDKNRPLANSLDAEGMAKLKASRQAKEILAAYKLKK